MKIVIKKDGRKQPFDREKLKNSILKAFESNDERDEYAAAKAENIVEFIENDKREEITADELGDLVERGLMSCKKKNVAKAYILFRNERDRERLGRTQLLRKVSTKLRAENIVNQNANVDEASFGGRKGEASNELMKEYALNFCMSSMSRNNHLANEIYIHDLDSYAVGMHNCLSIPFDKLLAEGFNTRQTDIRPAGSINTAFQLVAVIFQLQSLQQFGGVSATHLDWTMVPYVRKSFFKHWKDGIKFLKNIDKDFSYVDKSIDSISYKEYGDEVYNYAMAMTERELMQAVEGMYHNLNTLQSRSGNQLN